MQKFIKYLYLNVCDWNANVFYWLLIKYKRLSIVNLDFWFYDFFVYYLKIAKWEIIDYWLLSGLELLVQGGVRIAPSYARAYNYRGSFKYASLGDLQGAIADFDSAIRYDPDYAIAHANRGLLRYQQLGDIPGALADLNVAILLNPRDASTYIAILNEKLKF